MVDDPSASQFLQDNAPVRPTLNRHVADAAPSVKCSPFMTNNTPSPMCACSMPRRKEPTGVRSREWTREPDRAVVRQSPGARKVGRPHWVWQLLCRGWPWRDQDRWLTSSDIFCTIASPLVRHAEVVQRDRLTQRARRQPILAIRRGLIDLDVEDEAISLRAGGLHTGPSVALHWRV